MLVLARKKDEEIVIGDDIVLKIVRIGRTSVRVGITAPSDVRILHKPASGAVDVHRSVERSD